uniref:Uncharacterized protein n=1 Tax=Anguilla anguilla TaxID=7936 RepID=A0A0E9P817_ANGAN
MLKTSCTGASKQCYTVLKDQCLAACQL